MKKVLIICGILIIFLISFMVGFKIYNNVNTNIENEEIEKTSEEKTPKKVSYIKERAEMTSYTLYDFEGVDLLREDMIWNSKSRLYHKIITNMEDYNVYNKRIDLPDMSENDFLNYSIAVITYENPREIYEIDSYISEIIVEGETSNIILKQYDNPRENCKNNVLWAVVNKEMLKENIVCNYK